MAKERFCIFCQKPYSYCPSCNNKSEPSWKFNFDTERCHDLYDVIAGYNIGIKKIEDVKAVMDKYNVTDYSEYSEKLQNELKNLNTNSEKTGAAEEASEDKAKDDNAEESKPEHYNPYKSKKMNKKYNFERRVNTEE